MKARILILLTAIVILSGCAVTLTEFEDLQGRVEKLENQTGVEPYSKVDNTKEEQLADLQRQNQLILSQMQAINKRLEITENMLYDIESKQVIVEAVTETAIVEKEPEITKAPAVDKPTEVVNVSEYYNEGRRLYEKQDYPGAIRIFKIIIDNYANDTLAGPAQYWTGECYYGLADFSAAKNEFEKVITNYPSSTKFIDAQFKVALCYLNLNQKAKAKSELNRIKKEYPKYENMDKVDSYLNRI
ncbi:MAG: tetratricopeptide repeat protein [Candidatus Cloacimonetes bacterium]|nr:tetratricopeptide repeat protein [Candidatus Cloacimonadota bacterium]